LSALLSAAVAVINFPIGRLMAVGLLLGGLAATRQRLGPLLLSPVWIVVLGYLGLALTGALFYDDIADANGGAGIRIDLTGQASRDTFWLLMTAATSVLATATITSRVRCPVNPESRPTSLRTTSELNLLLLLASILPLVMVILSSGPGRILERDNYLAGPPGAISGIGVNLALAASLGLGYLLTQRLSAPRRVVVLVLIACYGLLFLSFGTRGLALFPILVAAGAYAGRGNLRTKIALGVCGVLGLYLVQLPLYLRGLDHHGLVPYATALPDFFGRALQPAVVGQTVLISYGTIGKTAYEERPIPTGDLWVALNPGPGELSGWYEIADRHRLNIYTPYPALGELGNAGTVAVVAYYAFVGVVLAYLGRRVRFYLATRRPLVPLALLGLVDLFVLYSLQYNLRSANRLLLYAIAFDVAARTSRGLMRPQDD